jgi:hypothetical protein
MHPLSREMTESLIHHASVYAAADQSEGEAVSKGHSALKNEAQKGIKRGTTNSKIVRLKQEEWADDSGRE